MRLILAVLDIKGIWVKWYSLSPCLWISYYDLEYWGERRARITLFDEKWSSDYHGKLGASYPTLHGFNSNMEHSRSQQVTSKADTKVLQIIDRFKGINDLYIS